MGSAKHSYAFLIASKAGLDPHVRPVLSDLLRSLHEAQTPRIIMALRAQDPMPDWTTHVLRLTGDQAETILANDAFTPVQEIHHQPVTKALSVADESRPPVAELQNVNVKYHERHVRRFLPTMPDRSLTVRGR